MPNAQDVTLKQSCFILRASCYFHETFLFVLLLGLGLALSACQTIDATGERHLTLIGENQEIQMGKASDQDIVKTMGLYPDEELQAYVAEIGEQMARTTERPDLPWSFKVVDDDVVNAFALPGGYIYFTRGILAHFENEAQFAGVMAHEIAHVTAKHSVVRMSKAMVAQLGLGVAMVALPDLRDFAPVIGQGMQLLFLKFSRDDETESDLLGVRYMRNVRQDPRELINVMAMLERQSEARGGGMLPQWASTHPHPANRMQQLDAHISSLPPLEYQPVNREKYLRMLDGMVYGKNPRQGIIKENMFYHPDMRFGYAFPPKWTIINQRAAVVGVSPDKDAVIQMSLVKADSPQAALQELFRQQNIQGQSSKRERINDMPAATGSFLAKSGQSVIQGRATYIAYSDRMFQIVGYAPQATWSGYAEAVERSMYSFDELADRRLLEAKPMTIKIMRIKKSMPLRRFHEEQEVSIPVDELARLNQAEVDEVLQQGRLFKLVQGKLP